jgi:phage terminase large subunit-like protein
VQTSVVKDIPRLGRKPKTEVEAAREQRRILAESSLEEFIKLVHPKRHLGSIHREIITWWTSSNAKSHQLLLLPRDHMKSALIAYRVAWELTKNPTLRFLYISSTSNLATKQLKFIKDILTNDVYTAHWPNMVIREESKREKWTEREISVDHPKRREESIRDPSIFTAGLTTNIVGLHSDVNVLDDVVVGNNAYTQETRDKVLDQYGALSAIGGATGRVWVVGTRYHPEDLYGELLSREIKQFDSMGNSIRSENLYDHKEWPVENVGDGTGEFIWPRSQRSDGQWFGFNAEILAVKKSEYKNQTYFRAQYYNDPHDVDSSPIKRDYFQYYDPKWITKQNYKWAYQRQPLNVFASVDFAFSTGKKSDYTAIVVIGVDGQNNYYVLEIDRFKTDQPSEYFKHILKLHEKWGFRKIRAEVNVAQAVLVNDFKENYIRKYGLSLSVDEYRPTRSMGMKEERILAVLEPRYQNRQIWHYVGGHCQTLEEELIYRNSAHDDIKDALASAIDFSTAPVNFYRIQKENTNVYTFNNRWGGVA